MSSEPISNDEAIRRLSFLTEEYLPQAVWTIGGAFRFDHSLKVLQHFLRTSFGLRVINRVEGAPACKWNLDEAAPQLPMPLPEACQQMEDYARLNMGITLVFDNPFLKEEDLKDSYANQLLSEFFKRDRLRKNAVSVASDLLAAHIRRNFPSLPVFCSAKRAMVETGKRQAAFYNKLAELYQRVCLHPADAVRPAVYEGIEQPERFDVIINDPYLRSNSVRRDLLRLMAEMRRDPYNADLQRRQRELLARSGDFRIDASALKQRQSCILSRAEARALYAAGFHSMIIQAANFRNEITLLWEIFRCMLDPKAELSNKNALIASSAMADFGIPSYRLPSGLKSFSFSRTES